MDYIIYDVDGNILRTGNAPTSMVALQAQAGEFVMEGVADDATQIVVEGALQPKPVDTAAVEVEVQNEMRFLRDAKLAETDWTQLADSPLNNPAKAQWQSYRQSLRDLPANYPNETDMANVVFPTPPTT